MIFGAYSLILEDDSTKYMLITGEGLPHTAGTHFVASEGVAVFVLGQAAGTLTVVRMVDPPLGVTTHTIKNTSIVNRFFTGFIPGMFRCVLCYCSSLPMNATGTF